MKQETKSESKGSASMWIGVGVVFTLMAMAWTAMFFFAHKHRAADVPLETIKEAR
jgi:flagellar basal body-associated protein FliL